MKMNILKQIRKILRFGKPRIRVINEKDILIERLADKLCRHRASVGKGKGKSYWKSQARIAIDFCEENRNEIM